MLKTTASIDHKPISVNGPSQLIKPENIHGVRSVYFTSANIRIFIVSIFNGSDAACMKF